MPTLASDPSRWRFTGAPPPAGAVPPLPPPPTAAPSAPPASSPAPAATASPAVAPPAAPVSTPAVGAAPAPPAPPAPAGRAPNLGTYTSLANKTRAATISDYKAKAGENPRNLGPHGYGSIDEYTTAISNWDHGFNAAVNGNAGDYAGGKILYSDDPGAQELMWGPGGQPGGPGGGGAPGGGSSDPNSIDGFIASLMSGKNQPYSDEEIGRQTELATNQRSADLAASNRSAAAAAARGGVGGPAMQALLEQNSREQRGGLSSDVANVRSEANKENWGAKVQGLQAALTKLANDRDYAIQNARNANEAEGIRKQFDGKMAEVNAQLKISANTLAAQERMQGAAAGASGAAQSREQDFWNQRFAATNAREDANYQRDLPVELLRLGMGTVGTSPRP